MRAKKEGICLSIYDKEEILYLSATWVQVKEVPVYLPLYACVMFLYHLYSLRREEKRSKKWIHHYGFKTLLRNLLFSQLRECFYYVAS